MNWFWIIVVVGILFWIFSPHSSDKPQELAQEEIISELQQQVQNLQSQQNQEKKEIQDLQTENQSLKEKVDNINSCGGIWRYGFCNY